MAARLYGMARRTEQTQMNRRHSGASYRLSKPTSYDRQPNSSSPGDQDFESRLLRRCVRLSRVPRTMSANVAASAAGLGLVRDVRRPSSGDPPARDRWFESIFLQRTVRLSQEVARRGREARLFARVCGPDSAPRSAETGIARCMAPTGGNISVGPNSSTAASMRRWLNEFRAGSGKAEHGALLLPGPR